MELVDQITVCPVQLNDIKTGLNGPLDASLEFLNHCLYFFSGQLARSFVLGTKRNGGRGYR
ncbi:hypothetical protein D3C74_414730 [compost metagenome]